MLTIGEAIAAAQQADEAFERALRKVGAGRWTTATDELWTDETTAAYQAKVAADIAMHEAFELSRR